MIKKNIKELQKVYKAKLLLLKKKKKLKSLNNLNVFFNVFKYFSSLRFFKVKKYPFARFAYIISNLHLRKKLYTMYSSLFCRGLYSFFKKLLKIKIFKKEYKLLLKFFKRWEKKFIFLRFLYKRRFRFFFEEKYKYKKIKKIRYLEKSRRFFKKKVIKTKEQLLLEEEKANFAEHITENLNRLKAKWHAIKYKKVKKVTKKRFFFVQKRKMKKDKSSILKRIAFMLTYKEERKRKGYRLKKGEKRRKSNLILRHNIKGTFKERKAFGEKLYKAFSKSEKKVRWYLKDRKKTLWRKSLLIKKYKRILYRRKKRTGILHFRKYYSNYYVTLTDLSYNVIFTCSAGSVSTGRNKKTKMSNAVAIPIFYRIGFFLKAFKIRSLKFVFRTRMDKMFFIAQNYFKKRRFRVKSFSLVYKAPHHLGQRTQKPRRI